MIETLILKIEEDSIMRIMILIMNIKIIDLMVEEWTEVDIKCKEEEVNLEVEK